ncbi:hypothetical protein O1611_g775 [Lasiodiplodia mahajangana]|uniref:Uncharacterized protein n=1 Tax=Lasiodiplodia mahajangana TaxID=1108764 RepID=A0ACC2JZ80_9PEZI|nr:hypothetical protein O1611_g775 [Lasiodiplodia mahajangana]
MPESGSDASTMSESDSDASTMPEIPSAWDELGRCLDNIESSGDFATMARHELAPNPVIQVDGEIIPLPLRDSDAESIKKLSRQAPFGNGEKTVVDTTVRRTWELSVDSFRLMNPAWPSFLKSLLKEVMKNLGIVGSAHAQAHKLLLYEKDSFFLPHKDSQKEKGMIATLVICLPSEHEGGEVHLSHAGQKRMLNTSESSLFDTTALAWFSDVTHEVQKIISGHRLVLTYNIIHKEGLEFSAGAFGKQLNTVNNALALCVNHDPGFGVKLYPLSHQYSREGLSAHNLKGRDLAVCQILHKLCSQHGLYLLLGRTTTELSRPPERYEDDNNNNDEVLFSLNFVHGLNGAELWKDTTTLAYESFLKDPYYDGREEDDYEESEYLGNEPAPEVFKYYDAVAIICRKIHLAARLNSTYTINVQNMMLEAMRDAENYPDANNGAPNGSLTVLEHIARYQWNRSAWKPAGINARIIEWAWQRDHRDLYIVSVAASINREPDSGAMNAVAKIINSDISEAEDKTVVEWDEYLGDAIDKVPNLTSLARGLAEVENAIVDGLKPSFSSWKIGKEQDKFDSKKLLDLGDEGFITSRLENADWLTESLVPALSARSEKTLIIQIVQKLLKNKPEEIQPSAINAARKVLENTYSKVAVGSGGVNYTSSMKYFIKLLELSLAHGLNSIVDKLLDAAWANISTCDTAEDSKPFKKEVVESFLNDLGQLLKKHEFSHLDSMRELFTFLIRQHLYVNVPSYPKKLPGWSFKPRGCGCKKWCEELDDFLKAEDAPEHEFQIEPDSGHRYHIESRIDEHTNWSGNPSSLFQCNYDQETRKLKVSKREGKEFEIALEKYNRSVTNLEKPLVGLRYEYMKGLLGDAVYKELVMLEGVENSKGAQELAAAVSASGTKRAGDESVENPKGAKQRRG